MMSDITDEINIAFKLYLKVTLILYCHPKDFCQTHGYKKVLVILIPSEEGTRVWPKFINRLGPLFMF